MDDLDDAPSVPGLLVEGRLGAGAHAQVWSARRGAERVAVKVARPGAQDRLRREADLLDRVRHPHVVRLLDVLDLPGGVALVLEHADGGSLAELVAARGRLTPREVTTAVVPVARALAALHEQGLVHGDVTASNVLLTGNGRPLLADLGVAAFGDVPRDGLLDARWGTPGWTDPASIGRVHPGTDADVWALGALIRHCLTGSPSGEPDGDPAEPERATLLAVAARCAAPPQRRLGAAQVARAVWQACPPEPLRFAGPASPRAPGAPSAPEITRRIRVAASAPLPQRSRSRRPSGRRPSRSGVSRALPWVGVVVGAVVGAALVGAVAVAVVGAAPRADRARVVAAAPAPGDEDLMGVVRRLAGARAEALETGSPERLGEVDAAASPALAADTQVLAALGRRGLRYQGLTFSVEAVGVVRTSGDHARVTATVATSAFRQVDPAGTVIADVPAQAPHPVTLDLVRTAEGWRVASAVEV